MTPSADAVLERLADPGRPRIRWPAAVLVAHPDDETIGLGGQIDRFDDLLVVHVTDGSPHDPGDARAKGFPTREAYAAARRGELAEAMALAGLADRCRLVCLDVVDQTTAHRLAEIARRLTALFAGREIAAVVTHAYEGGHPDHDATAFAVHAACRMAAKAPAVIEMPLYHLGPEGFVAQRFPAGEPQGSVVPLDAARQALKRRMLAAHRSQAATLGPFADVSAERFRAGSAPDFDRLPNGGRLNYERFGWGIDGAGWLERTAAARAELGLPPWR